MMSVFSNINVALTGRSADWWKHKVDGAVKFGSRFGWVEQNNGVCQIYSLVVFWVSWRGSSCILYSDIFKYQHHDITCTDTTQHKPFQVSQHCNADGLFLFPIFLLLYFLFFSHPPLFSAFSFHVFPLITALSVFLLLFNNNFCLFFIEMSLFTS